MKQSGRAFGRGRTRLVASDDRGILAHSAGWTRSAKPPSRPGGRLVAKCWSRSPHVSQGREVKPRGGAAPLSAGSGPWWSAARPRSGSAGRPTAASSGCGSARAACRGRRIGCAACHGCWVATPFIAVDFGARLDQSHGPSHPVDDQECGRPATDREHEPEEERQIEFARRFTVRAQDPRSGPDQPDDQARLVVPAHVGSQADPLSA